MLVSQLEALILNQREPRAFAGIRVIAIGLERLDLGRTSRGRPRFAASDPRFPRHIKISRDPNSLKQGGARHLVRGFDDHRWLFV